MVHACAESWKEVFSSWGTGIGCAQAACTCSKSVRSTPGGNRGKDGPARRLEGSVIVDSGGVEECSSQL